MGIQGLLPLLKSIQKPTELKKFSGETLAVDAYGWLHRGAVSCAIDLAQGKPTRRYVDFAMHRVRMAKHFGVTPYLVFDGDFLPSKACTEASRAKRREESRKVGLELLKAGKPSQAHLELQKAIDVTPEMARHLIEELKKAGVPYVVAPYEADAQLVYLEKQGLVSGIISEDSDLLVFGAKRLLTKLDQHGQCIEINRRDFCACREISLTGWTDNEFRQMAILSGCDYLDSISSMGLKTAYRMMRKYKTADRVIRMLQFEGKFKVPEDYLAAFRQAELTFLHQRVFCPKKQELVLLTEPPAPINLDEMPYIGAKVEPPLARAIALGDVNPITKEPIALAVLPEKKKTGTPRPAAAVQPRAPGKPIDSYFRGGRRIPLGEMDPNCFTVEPRQAGTLRPSEPRPPVFPLPRPYIGGPESVQGAAPLRPYITGQPHRRRTEPISQLLSGLDASVAPSSASRRRTTGALSQHVSRAEPGGGTHARPSKKPRLCDEGTPGESSGELAERSRFFPVKPKKRLSAPPRLHPEAFLMSDDSIEEALLSLPDVDGWNSSNLKKHRASLDIFQDATPAAAAPAESAPSEPGIGNQGSSAGGWSPSPAGTAPQRPVGEAPRPATHMREAVRRFSYTPMSKPAGRARVSHGLPTPVSSTQGSTTKSTLPSEPRLTPLQRIGSRAFQRGKPTAPSPAARKAGRHPEPAGGGIDSMTPQDPVADPWLVPLPKVDLAEVEALNDVAGSEDQIIPDSDGDEGALEGAGSSEDGELGTRATFRRRLDLSGFLCA